MPDTRMERKINGIKLNSKKTETNRDGDLIYDKICILNQWRKDGLFDEWIWDSYKVF